MAGRISLYVRLQKVTLYLSIKKAPAEFPQALFVCMPYLFFVLISCLFGKQANGNVTA